MKSKKIIATLLTFSIMSGVLMTGCKNGNTSDRRREETENNLTEHEVTSKYDRNIIASSSVTNNELTGYADFGISLLQNSFDGSNEMISPLSAVIALGMTANGANNSTLQCMEDVLGMSVSDINEFALALSENGDSLIPANAIWLNTRDNLVLRDDYIQTVVDWYNAPIYAEYFDNNTLDEINTFVDDNTNGQIPLLLNQLPDDAEMVLVNALCFESEWATHFESDHIHDRTFTDINGNESTVSMMYQNINGYICGDDETGFCKPYIDGRYEFIALLPNEDIEITDYINNLTGEELIALINGISYTEVDIGLPAFEMDYSCDMSEILRDMGMEEAFSNQANFTNMVDMDQMDDSFPGICISSVIQKTHIRVDSEGTQAAAATAVIMETCAAAEADPYIPPQVILDRPFMYMIVDTENSVPVFMGVYSEV